MRNILILGAASLALAACSSGDGDKDGDGKISESEMKAEASKVQLQPGEWENTVEFVDVKLQNPPKDAPAGMVEAMVSGMKGRKMTSKSCITQEEADNPGAEFFSPEENDDCEMQKFSMSGGKIDVEMTCKEKGKGAGGAMKMAMNGDYSSSAYNMTMKMNGGANGVTMDITARNSGKRIGDCPS